jgi:putative transport protein
MIADLIDRLNSVPLAGLMLVVAIGYSLGRLRWRWLTLGPAGGTLLVALLLGGLGLDIQRMYGVENPGLTIGTLGFALFVYSVGFEAGPRFFSVLFGGPGWRFVVVGTVVNVVALVVAVLAAKVLGLDEAGAAGTLSGALTSFATYAAAAEVVKAPSLVLIFAITYPIGLAAVFLLVQLVPRLSHEDLSADTEPDASWDSTAHDRGAEKRRAFTVSSPSVIGRSLGDLDLTHRTGCYVVRVHRGPEIILPDAATVLEEDDHVLVQGRLDELMVFSGLVGAEVADEELVGASGRRIVVLDRRADGKTLAELDLIRRHRSLVTGIDRSGIVIEPRAEEIVCRGDVLEVTGRSADVRAVATELGRFERPVYETDIAIYAGGIFLGLLLGRFRVGGMTLLGTAGGLLLSGVLLGRFRRIGRLSANVPRAARQLVRDLGILLFVAEMGVWAGDQPLSSIEGSVTPAIVAAVFVVVVPMLAAVFVGRRLLRLRPVDTWGSVCGGMTSSAALVALKHAADSNEPAVSYAASFAIASVLVTIAGRVVVFLV